MDKKSKLDLNSEQLNTGLDQTVQEEGVDESLKTGALDQKSENVVTPVVKSHEERVQDALALNVTPNLGAFGSDVGVKDAVTTLIETQAATLKGWGITANAAKKLSTFLIYLKNASDINASWGALEGVNKHSVTKSPSLSEPKDPTLNSAFVAEWESANPQQKTLQDEFESLRKLLVKDNEVKQADWGKALAVLGALATAGQSVSMNIGAGILPQWIKMHTVYGPGTGAPQGVPFHKGMKNLETHVEKHLLHQQGNPDIAEPAKWMQLLPFEVLRSDVEGLQGSLKIEDGDLDAMFPNSATKLDPGNAKATVFFFGTFLQRGENKALVDSLRVKYTAAYEKKATALLATATKPFVIDGGGKTQIIGPSDPFITFARIQKDLSLSIMSAYIPTDLSGTVSSESGKKVWDL
jgi:hypothetical protein